MERQTVMQNLAQIEEAILGGTVARRGETVISHGEGCWLWDTDGKRYLDMGSAQGVAMLGHCHPSLSAAIAQQAQQLISCPGFLYNDMRARFAAKLVEVLPVHLPNVFLGNSGSEVMDAALKYARLVTGRTGFVAANKGFHGRTVGALSVTWEPTYRKSFLPLLETRHISYNNIEKLDVSIDDSIAALVLEVVQGEGGVHPGQVEFLQAAQTLCRERGALLILDEIQTGFGRTGKWFAHQHYDLQPDMMTLAKGIGAGFPMGALAYSQRVRSVLFQGAHGSTFGGNPLACAAGLAAITTYQEAQIIEHAAAMGDYLFGRLREELDGRSVVREIRGLGLMVGIELREKVAPTLKALMIDHGVIALPAGPNVLRLLPPLIIDRDEVDLAVAAIGRVLPR